MSRYIIVIILTLAGGVNLLSFFESGELIYVVLALFCFIAPFLLK